MSTRTVLIETDPSGGFAYERPLFGSIVAILTDPGTMETPDIVISDAETSTTVRSLTALAAKDYWQPGTPVVVFGTVRVEVTGGGDTKTGKVRFLLET